MILKIARNVYNHSWNVPLNIQADTRANVFWKVCNFADQYLSPNTSLVIDTKDNTRNPQVLSNGVKYAKWGSYVLFIGALVIHSQYQKKAWALFLGLALTKLANRYHFYPANPPTIKKSSNPAKNKTDSPKIKKDLSSLTPTEKACAETLLQVPDDPSLLDLTSILQPLEDVKVPNLMDDFSYISDLQKIGHAFPTYGKQKTKDGYLVIQTIEFRANGRWSVQNLTHTQSQNYTNKLRFIIKKIHEEKDLKRKEDLYRELCNNFLDCVPAQQSYVDRKYRELCGSGAIQTLCRSIFEDLKLATLELLIQKNHGNILQQHSHTFYLQLPHLKSKYLKELADREIFIEGYTRVNSDHIYVSNQSHMPFVPNAKEQFIALLKQELPTFLVRFKEEFNKNAALANSALQQFTLAWGIGYFKEYIQDYTTLYDNLPKPTEDQEDQAEQYYSDAEIYLVLKTYKLISWPEKK